MKCIDCHEDILHEVRPQVFTYKGKTITLNQPGWYCSCKESIHLGDDWKATEAELIAFRTKIDAEEKEDD